MPVRCSKIIETIRKAAPEENAADWDNTGLQCGDPDRPVESVVLALDVRPETIEFALENRSGLIIAHHPLLLTPLKRVDAGTSPGRELIRLIEHRITVYAAHTNVDASPVLSMNASMGKRLPLRDFGPVAVPVQTPAMKLVTFVPPESLDRVRSALAEAGAGVIGDYTFCSFGLEGTGTFLGGAETHPALGRKGVLEKVQEVRLEMICPRRRLDRILSALWDSHPYEEVAYDLYPLAGYRSEAHYLWRGEVESEMTLAEFASAVKEDFGGGTASVKYAGDPDQPIRRVAWCSGSGKSLLAEVARLEVDVFVTGDCGHHDALAFLSDGIALVDVDHYHTERFFIDNLHHFLSQELEGESVTFLPDPTGPVWRPADPESGLSP